jgi:hypothetical protein
MPRPHLLPVPNEDFRLTDSLATFRDYSEDLQGTGLRVINVTVASEAANVTGASEATNVTRRRRRTANRA